MLSELIVGAAYCCSSAGWIRSRAIEYSPLAAVERPLRDRRRRLTQRVPERDRAGGRSTLAVAQRDARADRSLPCPRNVRGQRPGVRARMRPFVGSKPRLRTPLTSIRGCRSSNGSARAHRTSGRAMQRIEDEAARIGLIGSICCCSTLDQQRQLQRHPGRAFGPRAAPYTTQRRVADRDIQLARPAGAYRRGPRGRSRCARPCNLSQRGYAHAGGTRRRDVRTGKPRHARGWRRRTWSHAGRPSEGVRAVLRAGTRERERRGTGSACRSRCDRAANGGTVDVETAQGGGAAFRVRLPRAASAELLRACSAAVRTVRHADHQSTSWACPVVRHPRPGDRARKAARGGGPSRQQDQHRQRRRSA